MKADAIRCEPAPVTIEAAAAGDSKEPAKFSVVAYTGGAMIVGGWDKPVVLDLDGIQFGNSIVANLDHDRTRRVGNVTAKVIENGQLRLDGIASAATESRREVIESAKQGFIWQASVEVNPQRVEEVKEGESVEVNGQVVNGPAYITRKGVLKGFAFVSHGADDNTSVSIAASAASQKGKDMKPEVKAWAESMGFDTSKLSDEQIAGLEANYQGKPAPPPQPAKIEASDPFAVHKAELARINGIRECANRFIEMRGIHELEAIEKMHDHAIDAKMSVQDFRNQMYEALIPTSPGIRQPAEKLRVNADILAAAVCMSGNLQSLENHFDERTLDAANKEFRHGIGLQQLWIEAARMNGYTGRASALDIDVHRAACGLTPVHASSSYHALTGILSNIANKFLQEGWGGGEMAWRQVTAIRNVRDFKQVSSYKLNGHLKYEKVGPDGQIKHGYTTEETYTNQAETYGRMFAVTRTDIINDDLGALTQVPRELGYGAADAFNDVFWTEFLSGDGTFFASGNNNTSTGVFSVAAALATLTAAELKFMQQTKPNGEPLGIMPDRILVPNGTYRAALSAMNSTLVVGSTGPTPDANTFKGNYQVITSAYLSNSKFSGYSAVKWYMLANPARLATIETAFLNGREAPVIETAEAAFNTLGVQMRGYHDFGCNLQEFRAGVQGSGA